MDSAIFQNPSDPDATFWKKAGKEHRGYAANITDTVDANGSVVADYQYDVNTRSDVNFLQESIEKTEATDDVTAIIADGAYVSEELTAQAVGKDTMALQERSRKMQAITAGKCIGPRGKG